MFRFKWVNRPLDLQAKIILGLLSVIIPIYALTLVVENKLMGPVLQEELKQVGINAAKTLSVELTTRKLLTRSEPEKIIEPLIQDLIYSHSSIIRMDIVIRDKVTKTLKILASNFEVNQESSDGSESSENSESLQSPLEWTETIQSKMEKDSDGHSVWEIWYPVKISQKSMIAPTAVVHVVVSLSLVSRMASALLKTTTLAAVFTILLLVIALSTFLRKTIENDRKLKRAEIQNLELYEKLHEAQREVLNMEKLAVMGQLTASFAHEIGTPLNAIGGHLQLLKNQIEKQVQNKSDAQLSRLSIISGQLAKIESIVKGFLQSTSKPLSQRQLIDPNQIINRTLGIILPRIETGEIQLKRDLDHTMGPLRMVPLDLEQILLNLLNNSIDSLKAKSTEASKKVLEVSSHTVSTDGRHWAELVIKDTGEGIPTEDLKNVLKPFFTTKPPSEGTGLGLTICQELVKKYGGDFNIKSKKGAWTQVTIRLPYES